MTARFATLKYRLACSAVALGLALPAGLSAAAERLTPESIINALTPKRPLTRSLAISPELQAREAETRKFIDTLRNRTTRSLTLGERQQIAAIAQEKPRIDLEIKFDFNSARISNSALPDMEALGKALSDPKLKGSSFVLAGHTDAVGGEEYNQGLSERRADTVKNFLVDKYGLSPEMLVTAGYGKTRLKDDKHPAAAVNRRVEVVNVVDKVAASDNK
jgi:outer membrane protein OmpA-like peptidoglycan-associated protein